MINNSVITSQRTVVRIAGFMFLCSLFVPVLNWIFVNSTFIIPGNAIETARNVLANEFLFRIGIINSLITSLIAVVLALTLYIILKPVNRDLALLALILKLTEGVLMAVITLCVFAALLILNAQASAAASEPVQTLVGLFFNDYMTVSSIPMLFLGLNFMLFFYLLFKSKFVPGILAGFGIVSYTLIFAYAVLTILLPHYAAIKIIQTLCWAPSCFFELITGIWLLIKGVNVQQAG
jgi:hypothetical protein